jgi:hypothetical protein
MNAPGRPTPSRSKRVVLGLLVFVVMFAVGASVQMLMKPPSLARPVRAVESGPQRHFESAHYVVRTTADDAQAQRVAADVEALRTAYLAFFPDLPARASPAPKHQLLLYGSRAEFQANNRSQPWAEAYYLAPQAVAYAEPGDARASHWMLHEATHQLSRELAGFPKAKWSDEGLASYFGASRMREGKLIAGEPDPDTYPLWWVVDLGLSGDRERDFAAERLVPLRALISGEGGPPIARTVNAHYIGYWSLSHFLIHHDGGRHAAAFRELLASGGGLAEFERRVGPLAEVEPQWYAHLQQQVEALRPCPELGCMEGDAIIVE